MEATEIEDLIEEEHFKKIEITEKIDEGLNEIFRAKYNSRDVVVKLHTEKRDENFFHDYEALALNEIRNRTDIPAPEILFFSEQESPSYFIMEEIEGLNGREIIDNTSFKEKKKLVNRFGEHLNKLHSSISFEEFGYLRRKGNSIHNWKKFRSWREMLLDHLRSDINSLADSRFEKFQEDAVKFIESRKDLLDREFNPVLIHDDNRYSNLICREGKIQAFLDWATGYNGEAGYDLVKAEFLLIDYELGSLSHEKKEELRDELYRGYGSDMRRDKQLRQLYLLASTVWAMKGYQNWSERLSEAERETVRQRLSREMEEVLD